MALQGIMINSRDEWNQEYLLELREKFLQQEYPSGPHFTRSLSVNRSDLIFATSSQKKPRRKIIAPRVVAQSPANPPYTVHLQEKDSGGNASVA